MIVETRTRRLRRAVSSDRWHVIHSEWTDRSDKPARYARSIVSEHEDRPGAVTAARLLSLTLKPRMSCRVRSQRDQVFVRPPGFKSRRFTRERR